VTNKENFRSPYAVAVWWLWVLFAVGNLIDLAVQGRDHLSVVAAAILLFVTGVVYVTAQRPKIVARQDTLEIVNPLRTHLVGWPAVVSVDASELVRVRCEWPGEPGVARKQVIYSWAVRSSRRKQVSADLRAQRRARAGGIGVFGAGSTGGYGQPSRVPPPAPVLDVDRIVTALNERADEARTAPDARPGPPVSTWSWTAVAAIVVPALVLLVAALT
jgi:hypothetical protein